MCGGSGSVTSEDLAPEPRRRLHVPLAEDNAVDRRVVERMLSREGHTIVEVTNGAEAVAAHREGAFDLLTMEVQVPVMDGFAARAAIGAEEARRGTRTPIVALTAHAREDDRERRLEAGRDDSLSIQRAELPRALDGAARGTLGVACPLR